MKKGLFVALLAALLASAAAAYGATRSSSGPDRAAAPAASGTTLVKCGKTMTLGFLYPATGPAASLGIPQRHWVDYYVKLWNKGRHKTKFKLQPEDTILGGPQSPAEAVKGAQALVPNANILGIIGPSGSQEVVATTQSFKDAGLPYISGSATRTTLTTDGTRTGYFFRVVPPDAQQSKDVVAYMTKTLKVKRVYIIDDQEAYSTGLADEVQAQLTAKGVTVGRDGVSQQQSDFSALIAKIPRDTQVVYLPWQLPPKGKAFGQQMKQSGRGSIKLFGSDGLFDAKFSSVGSNVYDSFFPLDVTSPTLKGYLKSHGGNGDYFGSPSYIAAQVIVTAVAKACKNGSASRAEVRGFVTKTHFLKSLLGIPVQFDRNGDIQRKKFPIYHSVKGKFTRVT